MSNLSFYQTLQEASELVGNPSAINPRIELLLLSLKNWDRTQLLLHYHELMPASEKEYFITLAQRVAAGEPVQYIVGRANFFGRFFDVNEDVLIPRLETEELVEYVIAHFDNEHLKVLDIGTGSGNIAITLKLAFSNWDITATDINEKSLAVAQQNAAKFNTDIHFEQGSMLEPVNGQTFDLIISNPPYIAEDEREYMDQSVLDYEPHTALFAPDHGLYWYKKISDELSSHLNSKGSLVCEIGFKQGLELKNYFQEKFPASTVRIIKDVNENDRILVLNL